MRFRRVSEGRVLVTASNLGPLRQTSAGVTTLEGQNPYRCFVIHVLAPIGLGAALYVLFRDPGLLVFDWISSMGLDPLVAALRAAVGDDRPPPFIVFSLPNCLWVYGTTSWMILIWRSNSNLFTVPWIYAGWAWAVGAELGQAVGAVPGTFDVTDLASATVACVLAPVFLVGVRRNGL